MILLRIKGNLLKKIHAVSYKYVCYLRLVNRVLRILIMKRWTRYQCVSFQWHMCRRGFYTEDLKDTGVLESWFIRS